MPDSEPLAGITDAIVDAIEAGIEDEVARFIRTLAASWPEGHIARDVLSATADDVASGEYRYPDIPRLRLGDQAGDGRG